MIQFNVRVSLRSVAVFLGSLLLVGLVVAVVFPIFARADASTGKPNYPLIVAKAIQASELVRRKAPETADKVRPYLPPFRAKSLEFSIRQLSPEGGEMVYEITTYGRTTRMRVPRVEARKPEFVR